MKKNQSIKATLKGTLLTLSLVILALTLTSCAGTSSANQAGQPTNLSIEEIEVIAANTYVNLVNAIANKSIEPDNQSVLNFSNKGTSTLTIINPSGKTFTISLGLVSKTTVVEGSMAIGGQRWCFEAYDNDTTRGEYYQAVIYTNQGWYYRDSFIEIGPTYRCNQGITATPYEAMHPAVD